MTDKLTQVGRLAFREEGEYWNAYFAAEHTMDGALLLGSIRLGVARHSPEIRAAFMKLVQSVFDEAAYALIGKAAIWSVPVAAPELERTKE
jgi:hypothetical protein